MLSGKVGNDIPVVPYEDIIRLLEQKILYFYSVKLKKKTIQIKDLKNLINDDLFNRFYRKEMKSQNKRYKMFHLMEIDPEVNFDDVGQYVQTNGIEIEYL